MLLETLLLIIIFLSAWFWSDSLAKREMAIKLGRNLAERCHLQLLDETVACNKVWLGRNNQGHAQLLRLYEFEVSANGSERMQCSLQLLGSQLYTWHIPPYAQTLN